MHGVQSIPRSERTRRQPLDPVAELTLGERQSQAAEFLDAFLAETKAERALVLLPLHV